MGAERQQGSMRSKDENKSLGINRRAGGDGEEVELGHQLRDSKNALITSASF